MMYEMMVWMGRNMETNVCGGVWAISGVAMGCCWRWAVGWVNNVHGAVWRGFMVGVTGAVGWKCVIYVLVENGCPCGV